MKKILLITVTLILLSSVTVSAGTNERYGDVPYISYIYNEYGESAEIPAPYTVEQVVDGKSLNTGDFLDPADFFYDNAGKIYIVDTGNNRIIVTDSDFHVISTIKEFSNDGKIDTFNQPGGIFVNNEKIYVSDTDNERILVFDLSCKLINVFAKPEIPTLSENYRFFPGRIAVDRGGRIYIIARDINRGIIQLNSDASFASFLGAPKVSVSFSDMVWDIFSTKEQKERMENYVPTEYSSIFMDSKDFIFAMASSNGVSPVSRINLTGTNVLRSKSNKYPSGDRPEISSQFTDVVSDSSGIYSVLDSKMGRIFTYSGDGYLLFAFGCLGSQSGTLRSPIAIEKIGDKLVVLDKFKGNITVYKLSLFGEKIMRAMQLQNTGNYQDSYQAWKEVSKLSTNYDYAFINMARIDLQNGNAKEALSKIKTTGNSYYYSIAFKEYRQSIMDRYFRIGFTVIFFLLLLIFILVKIRKRKPARPGAAADTVRGNIRYGLYIIFHPLDGFWDLKREKKNTFISAIVLFCLFALTFGLRAEFTGRLFTQSREVNALFEILRIAVPLLLWCLANWCFTTLMDGKGTLKDIFVSTSFALIPYIITALPMLIISNIITLEEGSLYLLADTIIYLWVGLLIFLGMIMTHDYSVSKGILAAGLSIIGICIIIFLLLLFMNLIQEIVGFAVKIYREAIYRTY